MSYSNILAALNTQLETITGFDNLIEWPNFKLNPGDNSGYLSASMLPNESEQATLGPEQRLIGIYQVLCKRRLNKGAEILDDADAVIALFTPDTELTSGDVTVRIQKTWASPAFDDGDWYIIPVSISWYTFA